MATMVATVWQDERIRVKLRVDCSKRDVFVANHVTNLSRGGLFIASEKPLPVNSELELTLALPGSPDEIRARGRVVWNYDIRKGTYHLTPGMGIKFLDMSREDWRRLLEFIVSLPAVTQSALH